MKKIPKKYIIISLIVISIIIGGYFINKKYFQKENNNQETEFQSIETTVKKISFDEEIEKNGTTKIKNEQKIKFNTSGRITEVNFKEGATVKKGDIIVAIDSSKAQTEINKASIELDKVKRNLDKIVDDLKDSKLKSAILDLEVAKTSIENKQKDLVYLKQKQENDLKSKQNELETAKNNYIIEEAKLKKDLAISRLDNKVLNGGNSLAEKNLAYEKQKRDYEDFKNNFQTKLDKKVNEYKLKLENAYYDLEKDVRDFDDVLKNTEELFSGRFSQYFSAKNNLNIGKIKENYYKANEDFKKFKEEYKKISGKSDSKNIIKTLETGKSFYENMYITLTYVEKGFNDSVTVESYSPTSEERKNGVNSNPGFNPSEHLGKFSGALSKSSSMRSSISNLIDELKSFESEEKIKKDLKDELEKSRIAIENTEVEIKKFLDEKDFSKNTFDASQKNILISLEELKISLDQKKLEFEKFEKTQKDEYRQLEINLEKEKITLKQQEEEFEKLKNLSKNDEFLSAEEAVKQAELNLENSRKGLENYIIQAPFDGVITKNSYLVGDRITENSEQFVSIVDPKIIEVLIDVNQSEVLKIQKDMNVKIILDSYPENILDGKISELDTTPKKDESSGISKFSVKVLIGDYGDLKLYTGMQASVKIKTNSIPESLVVPFSAVNSETDGRKYVTSIKDGKKEKKYVEVGFTDGKHYQIISGLKEGEKILEIDYDASKIKEENNQEGFMEEHPPM